MSVRKQLLSAFFVLALIPLAGLTFYSYISSLKSIRMTEEEVARRGTAEMASDIDAVYGELRERIDRVGPEPFQRLIYADIDEDSTSISQFYDELYTGFGELSSLIKSLEIRPSISPAFPRNGTNETNHSSRVRDTSSAIVDSFVLAIPQIPHNLAEGFNIPGTREFDIGIIVDRARDGRILQIKPTLPEIDALQRNVYIAEQIGKKFLGNYPDTSPDMHQKVRADSIRRSESLKEFRDFTSQHSDVTDQAIFASNHPLLSLPNIVSTDSMDEQVLMPLSIRSEMPGDYESDINARIAIRDLLRYVMPLASAESGEIPFAVSRDGRLYTTDRERLRKIDGLDLEPGSYSMIKHGDEEWVVVAREDTLSDITLGIARPIGENLRRLRKTMFQNLGFGVALICFALVGILRISSHMTRKISTLTSGAMRLAEGDLETRVPETSHDELGNLARAFNTMAADLKTQRKKVIEKERLEKELELSRQIQLEMLPKAPLRLPFAEIQGRSIPAREVGGDFFNFFPLNDHQVAILVGDVSGKGFPAALLMANIQATLKARLSANNNLSALAGELDRDVYDNSPEGTFLTLYIGVLDKSIQTLRWVSAGHNPQYLIRSDGTVETMGSTGRPLGLLPGASFTEGTVSIADGDTLFLYTDGLVESPDEKDEEFGNERLVRILSESVSQEPRNLLAFVEEELLRYRGSIPAHDDTTMVMMQVSRISDMNFGTNQQFH